MADEHEHVHTEGGNSTGMIVGLVILVIVIFLFFYYGLPAFQGQQGVNLNVPDKIDVNVNQEK